MNISRHARTWALGVLVALGLAAGALGGLHHWSSRDRGANPQVVPAAPWSRETLAPGVIRVQVRGEGYALGRAEGEALRGEIRDMVAFLKDELLGRGPLGLGKRDLLMARAWKLDAFLAPRHRDELRGMADGAGVSYGELLLVNTFDDLLHLMGCSSAVVQGDQGQPLLHARNLDYRIPQLARIKVVMEIETRGARLRTFGFPGYLGALTGMSSRGLALGSHTSNSRHEADGEPSGLVYRRILEECGSLEEAEALLRAARRTIGNNLAVSDGPRNRCGAFEIDALDLAVRPPEEGRLFVTNHFWTPDMQQVQPGRLWKASSGSQARVRCLADALPAGSVPSPELLQRAMGQRGSGRVWRTPANSGTVQSVIMEPATGRAWLALGEAPPVTEGTYLALPSAWRGLTGP